MLRKYLWCRLQEFCFGITQPNICSCSSIEMVSELLLWFAIFQEWCFVLYIICSVAKRNSSWQNGDQPGHTRGRECCVKRWVSSNKPYFLEQRYQRVQITSCCGRSLSFTLLNLYDTQVWFTSWSDDLVFMSLYLLFFWSLVAGSLRNKFNSLTIQRV